MAPKGLIFALLAAATSDFERSSSSAAGDKKKLVSTLLADAAWRRRMVRVAGGVVGCLLVLATVSLLALSTGPGGGGGETRNEEALALNKELEFAAIQAVLRHLDDNHDGSVDVQESEEFVQMELKDNTEKSHKFHETDSQITSEELWLSWQQNKVFYWTNAEVLQWLTVYVELPQYRDVFYKLNITGRHLPRLANNTGGMLQSLLGVTDSQHKQKLRLRAMDLVLFGPPNGKNSLWKDVVVALSVSLCVVGVAYALRQRRVTQQRIDMFLESFREKERQLRALQERLEEQKEETDGGEREERGGGEGDSSPAKSYPDSSPSPESEVSLPPFSRNSSMSASFDGSLARAQEEIALLRREVNDLNSQLSSSTLSRSLLQSLLQDSCRYEREHVERRRREAQDEITRAQRVCDKIKKRRASLFGTFHLANSSALEEAGLQITRAVNNMQKVSESFEEYHQRWRRIEQVCNFPIISASAMTSSPPPSFSIPRDSSSLSVKSLGRRDSIDGLLSPRDSFSRHSEGYGSSETESNSLTFRTSYDTPSSSLKRPRFSVSASGSLEKECSHLTSSSSLYNHQCSCPVLGSKSATLPRGHAQTLSPTASLPRNYTVSGRLVSRHDSYNAAVEGDGDYLPNDRGLRRRMSETGIEKIAGRRGSRDGGGGRRGSIKRQSAVGLSAVHEEEIFGRSQSREGVGPVAMSTGGVRGGVTRISGRSAQSTV